MSEQANPEEMIGSEQLVKALRDDPALKDLFCKCWPCTKAILEAILKKKPFPIPAPVEAFLLLFIKWGDLAHATVCK